MHRQAVLLPGSWPISRRRLLAGSAGAGLALALGRVVGRAQQQNATGTPAAATPGPNEAPWPKFNLNSATDAQLKAIPGVTDQTLAALKQARPYTGIAQFRQQASKSADSAAAAIERSIFVPIDPNNADADTLKQLPGVDDKAKALTGGRPFANAAAFLAALGKQVSADQATVAAGYLSDQAGATATWLKFNLDTATNDQFLTIPAVGDRMVREFNEYRPYGTILRFRQEIGKYVDAATVAAYEAYVFVAVDPNNADTETLKQLPGVGDDIPPP